MGVRCFSGQQCFNSQTSNLGDTVFFSSQSWHSGSAGSCEFAHQTLVSSVDLVKVFNFATPGNVWEELWEPRI